MSEVVGEEEGDAVRVGSDEVAKHFDVNAVLGKSQGCSGLCVGSSSPPMSAQPCMAPIDFISMDCMP